MTISDQKNEVLDVYDQAFYSNYIDGSTLSASIVIPLVLKLIPDVKSVVDVGCGVGTWLAEFKRNNVNFVRGYDGGSPPKDYLLINEEEYQKADFTTGYPNQEKVDLAVSLEVAEHLDEKYAEAFVKNLCSLSDIILFSAAIPGQGGTHHINERWPSYWADIFKAEGYRFFDVVRPQIWYDKRIEWWYRQNIFLVVKQDREDLIKSFCALVATQEHLLDIVHPETYSLVNDSAENLQNTIQQLNYNDKHLRDTNNQLNYAHNLAITERDAIISDCQARLQSVVNSNSWKLMSMPRSIGRVVRRLFHLA